VFITNKGPYLVFPRGTELDTTYLLGVLSSIPLDWYARRFVELGLNFFVFCPLPIPRPESDDPGRQRMIALAGRLACLDNQFLEWSKQIGVECGLLEEDAKQDMIHELDAVASHLYGLSEEHLVHIFETFHVGWDYHERLEETLKHYRQWAAKS